MKSIILARVSTEEQMNYQNNYMKKLGIPLAIVLAAIVLGASFMWIQYNKQESIEMQARWELDQKYEELEQERQQNEYEVQKKAEEEKFANELKCQGLLKDLKARWYNVTGIYYDSYLNTCMVNYNDTETGEAEEAPIGTMVDN